MTPYFADEWLTIYGGDCRAVLRELPAESVHCVVTSPPYWGLRDYGTATWEGGDPGCDHLPPKDIYAAAVAASTLDGGKSNQANAESSRSSYRDICGKCGAHRIDSQLGLEATPEAYVTALVDVFREVRRVLRADGTVWLNLGDSYATSNPVGRRDTEALFGGPSQDGSFTLNVRRETGLKAKDLVGIPWRVAFALQADGWYLRSDIIWSKPNPMPESVTDRPTKSHEYLFLLSKSARYWYDAAAVAEPLTDSSVSRLSQPTIDEQRGSDRVPGKTNGTMKAVGGPSWQERKAAGAHPGSHGVGSLVGSGTQREVHGVGLSHDLHTKPTRNLRSVWTIATAPYPGAHFATFPPKLVEPCIKAGCPPDGVVLDPFAGTGTVGLVAANLSRRAVLIDLNPDYLAQCLERNRQTPLGLPA